MAKEVWRIWGEHLDWTANLATLLHFRNTYKCLLKEVRHSRPVLLSVAYQRILCFFFLLFFNFTSIPSPSPPIMAEIRKLLSDVLCATPDQPSDSQGEVSTDERSERPHRTPLVQHTQIPGREESEALSNSPSPALGDYNVTTDSKVLINFTHWRQSISYASTKESGPLVLTLCFPME